MFLLILFLRNISILYIIILLFSYILPSNLGKVKSKILVFRKLYYFQVLFLKKMKTLLIFLILAILTLNRIINY